jgi:hypothetical protein
MTKLQQKLDREATEKAELKRLNSQLNTKVQVGLLCNCGRAAGGQGWGCGRLHNNSMLGDVGTLDAGPRAQCGTV